MDELRKRFESEYPGKIFLNDSIDEIRGYLLSKSWIGGDELIISLEKPGDGNMNYIKRVITNSRSIILKQARPWAEKYPDIYAPTERSAVEARYYQIINENAHLKAFSPDIYGIDNDSFIIAMSDLGNGLDYTCLFKKGSNLSVGEYKDILSYLSHLHNLSCEAFPYNGEMRELNHEHIFHVPFNEDNGLNLDDIQPGLQAASHPYKADQLLKSRIKELGEIYLLEGPVLIHGDYFPGSWLKSEHGIKVIDPEFSFKGYPEIDLGVMVAHLFMARQKRSLIESTFSMYNISANFDEKIFAGFVGVEILRRLLGVGQLPLTLSLEEKKDLMKKAAGWISIGKIDF